MGADRKWAKGKETDESGSKSVAGDGDVMPSTWQSNRVSLFSLWWAVQRLKMRGPCIITAWSLRSWARTLPNKMITSTQQLLQQNSYEYKAFISGKPKEKASHILPAARTTITAFVLSSCRHTTTCKVKLLKSVMQLRNRVKSVLSVAAGVTYCSLCWLMLSPPDLLLLFNCFDFFFIPYCCLMLFTSKAVKLKRDKTLLTLYPSLSLMKGDEVKTGKFIHNKHISLITFGAILEQINKHKVII